MTIRPSGVRHLPELLTARLDRLPMTRGDVGYGGPRIAGRVFRRAGAGADGDRGAGPVSRQDHHADDTGPVRDKRAGRLHRRALRRHVCRSDPVLLCRRPFRPARASSPSRCCGTASPASSWRCRPTAFGVNLWRFVSDVGLGVELVTVDAYLSELVPKGPRHGVRLPAGDQRHCRAWSPISGLAAGADRHRSAIDGWRWVVWIGSLAAIVIWSSGSACRRARAGWRSKAASTKPSRSWRAIEARVAADYGKPLPPPEPPHRQDPRKGASRGNLQRARTATARSC